MTEVGNQSASSLCLCLCLFFQICARCRRCLRFPIPFPTCLAVLLFRTFDKEREKESFIEIKKAPPTRSGVSRDARAKNSTRRASACACERTREECRGCEWKLFALCAFFEGGFQIFLSLPLSLSLSRSLRFLFYDSIFIRDALKRVV